jgi:sugar phosphate isomerase/epimerase
MQVGVFSFVFQPLLPFEGALDWIVETGATAVEIGSGGYVKENGTPYCTPRALLDDQKKLGSFCRAVAARNLRISALSCHGNPLHPKREIAALHRQDLRDGILLAERIGVKTVSLSPAAPATVTTRGFQTGSTAPGPWISATC